MIRITQHSGTALHNQLLVAKRAYFPAGTYTVTTPMIAKDNCLWEGDGVSTIIQIVGDISAIQAQYAESATRNYYITLRDMRINGIAGNTARLVDLRGVSYLTMDNVYVYGDPTGVSTSVGTLIDNTLGLSSFNGYNTLRNVYAIYGATGYYGEVNQLVIEGGAYNANSTRGIHLANCADVTLLGPEVSGNGGDYAAYTGTYPTGYYDQGGVFADNVAGLAGGGMWFETNADRINGLWSPNDLECTSTCSRINISSCRWDNANQGKLHGYGLDYGQDYGYGKFVSNLLDGAWVTVNCTTATATGLPTDVVGTRASASGAIGRYYMELLDYSECQANVGRVVVADFWVNAVNDPWPATGQCRVGISPSAAGEITGTAFLNVESVPGPQRITVPYTIAGTETNGLRFGVEFWQTGSIAAELGNVSVTLNRLD